jgi:hypothetical protein
VQTNDGNRRRDSTVNVVRFGVTSQSTTNQK